MITGAFKLKDGTELAIRDSNVAVNVDGTQYPLSDVIDALQCFFLPLYFSTDITEIHTFIPTGATKVQLMSIEADESGTDGLSVVMEHDIGTATSMTLSEEETSCTGYAGRAVMFTVSGTSDQTEIAALVCFS